MGHMKRISTGIAELDYALGGGTVMAEDGYQSEWGLVRPSVVLLEAEVGSGSSTLMQQVAAHVARTRGGVLLVSAEETVAALGARAERLHADSPNVWARHTDKMSSIETSLETSYQAVLVIVDAMQSMRRPEHEDQAPESTPEHRKAITSVASKIARKHHLCMVLISRTPQGSSREESSPEHEIADVVLTMKTEQTPSGRALRLKSLKNKFAGLVSL